MDPRPFLLVLLLSSCSPAERRADGHQAGTKSAPAPVKAGAEPAHGIRVGQRATDFTLPDDAGRPVRLSQHRDQAAVLLAFYPKDFTGG